MQKDLVEVYKGRKIEIHLVGYGAGRHTRVLVNGLDVTTQVAMPKTEPGKWDVALVAESVRKMIDSGAS